jgi:diguanylate cyclase (GGDEF)-like protein
MLAQPTAAVLLLVPVIALVIAYRAYYSERRKRENMSELYASSRILQSVPRLDTALGTLLEHARLMFKCDHAEILLFPSEPSHGAARAVAGPGDASTRLGPSHFGALEADAAELLATPPGILVLEHDSGPEAARRVIHSRGLRDAMLTLLRSETRVIGMLLVGNRLGAVNPFSAEDRNLMEMLASHTSVALENGQLEARLRHQASHDSLTNLANRTLFLERVERSLQGRPAHSVAVLFIDLDDFKTVNDSLGHAAGDQLLESVAERLRACVRPRDTVARLGGDEFAVLLADADTQESAQRVASRIQEAMRVPFSLGEDEVQVSGSIGIAAALGRDGNAADLLRDADVAMYMAKQRGKGTSAIFEPAMQEAVRRRHDMKADLERALARNELVAHYQPIVDLRTSEIVALEALVRWHHPEKGLLPPGEFIDLAEETGLISLLGRQVLYEACNQVSEWNARRPIGRRLDVSVNISVRQLSEPSFAGTVAWALEQTGLDPTHLILEITESVMLNDSDIVLESLAGLRHMGVRVAIDDFGTGYSSLGTLRHHAIDIIKLAKPFVDDLAHGPGHDDFVDAILHLGMSLERDMIAEGIEEAGQLEKLRGLDCRLGQGYYFSRPLPAGEMDSILSNEGYDRPVRLRVAG